MSLLFDKILTLENIVPEVSSDVEETPEPLSDKDRSKAISLFQKAISSNKGNKNEIKISKYYDKNTNKKHDRIIADIPDPITKSHKNIISYINNKQNDFTFVINKGNVFANPKKKRIRENVIQSLIDSDIFDCNLEKYELSNDEIQESHAILYKEYKKTNGLDYIDGYVPNKASIAIFKIPTYTSTIENLKVKLNKLGTKYKFSTNYNFKNNTVEFYAQKTDNYFVNESAYKTDYVTVDSHIVDSYIANNPVLKHIVNHGYPAHVVIEMLVIATMENPFLVTYLSPMHESMDDVYADELDNRLFFSFLDAYEASNLDISKIGSIINEDYNYIAESIIDSAKKTISRNVDKVVTHVKSGRLSPVIAKLKDGLEELTGLTEKKKEEMVVSGSIFIKLRRIFFKALVYYKSLPIVWALLPGGFIGFILKIVTTVAGLARVKKEVSGEEEGGVRRRCIAELETELKMTREKINDAKHDGDKKAKYQLMRLEGKIEQEIQRLKYGDPINKNKGILINSYNPMEPNSKLRAIYENLEVSKKHLLPLDISKYKSRDSRLMCLNTTMASIILPVTVPHAGILTVLSAMAPAIALPALLGLLGFTFYISSKDIFAVDFSSIDVKMNLNNQLTGVPVIAINDGIVVEAVGDKSSVKYSNYVLIDHGSFYALYGFIDGKSIKVKKGDQVKRGTVIANVGGVSNRIYNNKVIFHFEMTYTNLMNKKAFFDPLIEIPKTRTGFIDYKCTELTANDAVGTVNNAKAPAQFAKTFNTRMTLNTTGELSGKCFLTDVR